MTPFELITSIVGAAGFIFGLYQYYKNSKVKRAKTLSKLILQLWSDDEIRSAVLMFDYDNSWYDNDKRFRSREEEIHVNKALQYLSYICYLKKNHVLSNNEFRVFEYEIKRLFQNNCAIQYLKFLHDFSKEAIGNSFPFQDLLDYGVEKKMIDLASFQ